jgi:hypothetical protein
MAAVAGVGVARDRAGEAETASPDYDHLDTTTGPSTPPTLLITLLIFVVTPVITPVINIDWTSVLVVVLLNLLDHIGSAHQPTLFATLVVTLTIPHQELPSPQGSMTYS